MVRYGLTLHAGIGTGIVAGLGSPEPRVFLGAVWAPNFSDRDHDGVPDNVDQCPDQPEDKDGFKDDDGCPDPDNDQDTIPDTQDKCPNQAEDFDQFQDADGCPDPDNDNDGIDDLHDACPNDAEDHKPPKPNDGCPASKTDTDGDGIPDSVDKCPNDPEDKDGFQDDDGCPDPDNDNDGIPDNFDHCPNDPEDMDGFEDEDGCPDLDNDKDGVPDKLDKCPNEPETINGYQDEDGCPDSGPPPKAKIDLKSHQIVIMDKIFFDTNKATIKPVSFRAARSGGADPPRPLGDQGRDPGPHRRAGQHGAQHPAVEGTCRVGAHLPHQEGRRSGAHDLGRLWPDGADRRQQDQGRPRSQSPRRVPHHGRAEAREEGAARRR